VQRDLLCGLEGEFGQRHCSRCGLYFLSPRVPESRIGEYYPNSYGPYQQNGDAPLVRKAASLLGLEQRRRNIVERCLPAGNGSSRRILDVGCGAGDFLELLSDGPWERYAMDVARHTGGSFTGPFHEGRFDHSAPPFPCMDAITLWHVFEHLYHPRIALRNAAALLKPGGRLFLAIPDLRCMERALFGRFWVGWDPPRHVATYSHRGIKELLEEAGLKLVRVVPDACSSSLLALNIEFVLRSTGRHRNVQNSFFLKLLLYPLVFLSISLGLAPAKVYVAEK